MYKPQMITWNDSLSTGDSSLDNQHRILFDTLNDLGRAIQMGDSAEVIGKILGVLKFYASWHFQREEACFEQYQCPTADVNKKAHQNFVTTFDRLNQEYNKAGGSEALAIRVHEELTEWTYNHIVSVDTKLYPCIHRAQKPAAA
jgi:hemerythrin